MRISKIEIYGYGKWQNQIFELDRQFQIFRGLNESGKSTLRAFIEHILFGFPKKVKGKYPYEPLNGHSMGGKIWLTDTKFGNIMVERLLANGKVTFQCMMASGEPISESEWLDLVAQFDLNRFVQVFGFNEEQLQQYRLVSPEDIDHYLYSVTVSGSDRYLSLSNQLKKEADKQFTPKSNKRPLNQNLTELDKLGSQLAKSAQKNEDYLHLQQKLIKLEEEKRHQEGQIATLTKEEQHLQQLVNLWPTYEHFRKRQASLKDITDDNWQPKWELEMEKLHLQEEWLLEEINQNERYLSNLQSKQPTAPSLYDHPRWHKIVEIVTQQKKDIDMLVTELEATHQTKQALLEELKLERDFWQVDEELLPPELSEKQCRQLKDMEEDCDSHRIKIDQLEQRLQSIKSHQTHLERELDDAPQSSQPTISLQVFLIAVLGMFGVTLLVQQPIIRFFVLVLFGGGGIGWWWQQKSSHQSELHSYLSDELDKTMKEEQELTILIQQLTTEKQAIQLQQEGFIQQTLYANTAVRVEHLMQGDPLATIRNLQKEVTYAQKKISEINNSLQMFASDWDWYFHQVGGGVDMRYRQQWETIQRSVEFYLAQRKNEASQMQDVATIQERLLQLQQHYQDTRAAIQHLIEESQTSSEEAFQNKVEQIKMSEQLRLEVSQTEQVLAQQLNDLKGYPSRQIVEEAWHHKEQQLRESTNHYHHILASLAKVQEQSAVLEKDGTVHEVATAFEVKKSEVKEELLEWAGYQYASQWLIDSLKMQMPTRMETILEDASAYLNRLTFGRFVKIGFSNDSLQVMRYDWQPMTQLHLSRGTLDQVFVAIRLSFVKNLAAKISLPLLVDDGFVNFDGERKKIMLELLQEISSVSQVIYFTLDEAVPLETVGMTVLPTPGKKEDK